MNVQLKAHETFWMVTDPLSNNSTMVDVCGSSTLASVGRQVRGGLNIEQENPTIYFGPDAENHAKADANNRLKNRGAL